MSFNICRGTLGSLAMFTAIKMPHRASVNRLPLAGCFSQCDMSLLAPSGRIDRAFSCPLSEAQLSRPQRSGEAVNDPQRHFASANYCIAKLAG
jgi:hypothetical protein